MRESIVTLLLTIASVSGIATATDVDQPAVIKLPKNIIMIVGDGMGPSYTSAYRYYHDNPQTIEIEKTVFDRHLVGSISTYPAPISGYVTDSAAAATALATGIKTYNGAIGVDVNKLAVNSVLEWAKLKGKKTGVVVTSQINHATPASYLAHNESRENYNAIADSYIDDGIKADLYLGGGWQYFIREDRDLVDEFEQAGFQYVDDYSQLATLSKQEPVLGLFGNKGLPSAIDDTDKHRLALMTAAATAQLENKQGYFLLIEASQIDWAGHDNDIAKAMSEMDDLAKTVEFLENYVAKNPNTLVVLTADHSTGGFTIGANGDYLWEPDVLRTMKMSVDAIAMKLIEEDINLAKLSNLLNFDVTEQELSQLRTAKVDAQKSLANYLALNEIQKTKQQQPTIGKLLSKAIKLIINSRTNTGWTTGGHTAVDVPVFAFGAHRENFAGLQDNTDIAKQIFLLLGK